MFCFSYSLSFSWFFFHILENLHPFLKPVFCRSPKTCFLSGSWGHQKISLTVHPKASPTPPWGPSVPAPGMPQGYPVPFPAFSELLFGSLNWLWTWLVTLPLPGCWAVNRMCHHLYICLPSPGAEGRHPIAAVTGVTRCLCWGHCWPSDPLCLQSIPTPATPQHALQSQLPALPLPNQGNTLAPLWLAGGHI